MRNVHQVEVVLHVDDALNDGQKSDLVSHVRGCFGVEDARFTQGRDHLMLIDYDSDRVQVDELLSYVRETHTGAELIGPI